MCIAEILVSISVDAKIFVHNSIETNFSQDEKQKIVNSLSDDPDSSSSIFDLINSLKIVNASLISEVTPRISLDSDVLNFIVNK